MRVCRSEVERLRPYTRTPWNGHDSHAQHKPAQIVSKPNYAIVDQIPRITSKVHCAMTFNAQVALTNMLGQVERLPHCNYTRYVHGCLCVRGGIHCTYSGCSSCWLRFCGRKMAPKSGPIFRPDCVSPAFCFFVVSVKNGAVWLSALCHNTHTMESLTWAIQPQFKNLRWGGYSQIYPPVML